MKIVVLDRASMGYDTPFDKILALGEVCFYDSTSSVDVKEKIRGADVIVLNKVKITREVIASSPSLKLICVFATGFDNIDLDAAREANIGVCNVPAYSTDSVVLYTVSTVLALTTHLLEYSDYVRRGDYTKSGNPNLLTPVYHELRGKTWGIIGYGNIGKGVARVAEALGAKVIAVRKNKTVDEGIVDIDTLCRESDIITVHCPLNQQTRALINQERLGLMKKSAILVNEARGAVLDEYAVCDAVQSGKIAAFGTDVYSVEPFDENHPYNKIKDLPNVILTPHAAWAAYEARVRCVEIISNNISAFFEGKERLNRVD